MTHKNNNEYEKVMTIDRADWMNIVAHNAQEYVLSLVEAKVSKKNINKYIHGLRNNNPPDKRIYPPMQ
jgi:hypothetical protein